MTDIATGRLPPLDYAVARRNMVGSQLRTNSVRDAALVRALSELPREVFVPAPMRAFAYFDEDLNLGGGRWLVEPMVLARLLEAAEVKSGDVALVIGDATGYVAAILAKLAGYVVSLDCDADRVQKAAGVLADLGIDNIDLAHGPLQRGHTAKAPYDVIVFAGAIAAVPDAVRAQLGEGGRLVAVVQTCPRLGKLVRQVRSGDQFSLREAFDASAPMLPGMDAATGFRF